MGNDAKTRPTAESVDDFIDRQADPDRRQDCRDLVALMSAASGAAPAMWGGSIVGFGRYHYRYASGREGEWPVIGFSPRKGDLSLYLMPGVDRFPALLARLGRHRTGKSCLYVRRLADIDRAVLAELVGQSLAMMADQRID